jgi:protein ImuB
VLLRERLARVQLTAPTLELCLQAEDIAKRAPPNVELFATAASEHEGLTRLIERLQARLGAGQVQRLARVEDHRPERASETRAVEVAALAQGKSAARQPVEAKRKHGKGMATGKAAAPAARPVWLQQPEPLAEQRSRPLFEGRPLQLLSGPERIEAGWWDCALAGRDYFIAEASDGALVWIYRQRLPLARDAGDGVASDSGWFLQGRFG